MGRELALRMEGSLPPDLQGTLFRAGPGRDGGGGGGGMPGQPGALHAIELRDGEAVSYLGRESDADETVFWHAGSLLALPEVGLPSQYSRLLQPEEFAGRLTTPIASHVHRVAADGARVLFTVDDGLDRADPGPSGAGDHGDEGIEGDVDGIWLRIAEWDAAGALRSAQAIELERATWQHDIAVTRDHVVFIESPTTRLPESPGSTVPFGWVPGAEGWLGVVQRGNEEGRVRWFRLDPCLVTHILGAREVDPGRDDLAGVIELYVARYEVPEPGQPVDLTASVIGPGGVGLSTIGGSLAVLERWRIVGERVERAPLDERHIEYPRVDALCDGGTFRYGYCMQTTWAEGSAASGRGGAGGRAGPGGAAAAAAGDLATAAPVAPVGLLKFDLDRNEVAAWSPGPWRTVSEPVFVRAADGHSDEEGWLLTVVEDANLGTSDLYVLDASSMARGGPEAVIHLPEALPLRNHGEWVPADRYR